MNESMYTIQCRLCTSEETRRYFWEWMEKYTLLVNELLEKIPQHSQFQDWQRKGDIPRKTVGEILRPLEDNPSYAGLPDLFYTSVELICCETYKSWLALQQERKLRLLGKKRWLEAVESEFELSVTTDFNSDAVLAKAREIHNTAMQRLNRQGSKQKSLMRILLDMHDNTATNPLSRRAINHLLINNLQISEEEENLDKLSERLDKKRVEIRRLEEQLTSRLPKGRDPTGQRYLQILSHITSFPELSNDPQKLEAELEQLTTQRQLPLFNNSLYPIRFESSGKLCWSMLSQDSPNSSDTKNSVHQELPKSEKHQTKYHPQPQERICVQFRGIQDFTFKIKCDRRQLPIFRQFLVDYQTYEERPKEERFSEGLFALRSACLIWRKDDTKHPSKKKRANDQQEDRLKPWNTHRLYLHCTVGRRLLTAEGTEQVREENKNKTIQELKGKQNLEVSELQKLGLNKNQINYVKRRRSTLHRLESNPSPPRPKAISYEGQPHIVIGISFSRHQSVTIAIVDVKKQEVLECQSAKELLNRGGSRYLWRNGLKEPVLRDGTQRQHPNGGKLYIRKRKYARCKPYRLVEQLHQRHQRNCRQRMQEQKQDRYRETNSDSNLGLYVDRLIAFRIVELALQRKAGTIVIPQLKGIRESVESDIRAQAERLFPNEKERQKEYAKHYRVSFHRWSYARLSECIIECAKREGIAVVLGKQPSQGNLEQKALAIALSSYNVKTS